MEMLISSRQMFELERRFFSQGNASLPLMRKASQGAFDALCQSYGELSHRSVYVFCGNNGGDGWGVARLARSAGADVTVVAPQLPSVDRADARAMYEEAVHLGVAVCQSPSDLPRPDVCVDAMYGIGLNRPVQGDMLEGIRRVNEDRRAGSYVMAVDIPSGHNPDTGRRMGECVHADLTVTFEYRKYGHLLGDGLDACGEIAVVPLGLGEADPESALFAMEDADAARLMPARRRNMHKGDCGRLLIVAGSMGLCGAAIYAARSALRFGTGLVTLAVPRSVVPIMQGAVPGAMCLGLPEADGRLSLEASDALRGALSGKDAFVIGPGLGAVPPELVTAALDSGLPGVVDADALNALSTDPVLLSRLSGKHVITPHPGEAGRLLRRVADDPARDSAILHKATCAVVLLKGASTVVTGERQTLIYSGSGGMATGGSGDVLSGMIGALLSQGVEAEDAACAAAHIHGLSGSRAADVLSQTCMNASDIIDCLPETVRDLSTRFGIVL